MEERVFEYSNCTIKVQITKDKAKLHKATEYFFIEVIKENKCINMDK